MILGLYFGQNPKGMACFDIAGLIGKKNIEIETYKRAIKNFLVFIGSNP
jgi:hypothetical protein